MQNVKTAQVNGMLIALLWKSLTYFIIFVLKLSWICSEGLSKTAGMILKGLHDQCKVRSLKNGPTVVKIIHTYILFAWLSCPFIVAAVAHCEIESHT